MTAYCPHYSGWITHYNKQLNRMDFVRGRCKQWTCPYCAELNKRIWVGRMLYAINEMQGNWSFITLTAHERCRTKGLSHLNLATSWNRMNLAAKRASKAGRYEDKSERKRKYKTVQFDPFEFAFVRVWELHPTSGAFHAHLLFRGWPPEWWVKDTARHSGMGYKASASDLRTDPAQAVFYCAKYMTKQDDVFPRGTRRIVCSQNFPDKYTHEDGWIYVGQELKPADLYNYAWSKNLQAYDIQLQQEITREYESSPDYS